jgi:hypothetical protein
MYEEINALPNWNWERTQSYRNRAGRYKISMHEAGFKCRYCRAEVHALQRLSGVQNRNHCPFCLWSRHVDHTHAGDRMSACKAIMQPIGLTVKQSRNKYGWASYGELMLIHRCSECGKLSINRIAADDLIERLMEIYYASIGLDVVTLNQLEICGIRLLKEEDVNLVVNQLHGTIQN